MILSHLHIFKVYLRILSVSEHHGRAEQLLVRCWFIVMYTGTSLDTKGLSEVKYGLEGVMVSKYTLSQSHMALCNSIALWQHLNRNLPLDAAKIVSINS